MAKQTHSLTGVEVLLPSEDGGPVPERRGVARNIIDSISKILCVEILRFSVKKKMAGGHAFHGQVC